MKVPYFRQWTQDFDHLLALRRRMMDALGIAPKTISSDVREDLRQTMLTCSSCPLDAACGAWLETVDTAEDPPEFCRNRNLFRALMVAR